MYEHHLSTIAVLAQKLVGFHQPEFRIQLFQLCRSSGSAAVFVKKKSRRLTDKVSSRLQLAIDLEIEMIAPAAPLTAGGTLQAARCKRLSARGKP